MTSAHLAPVTAVHGARPAGGAKHAAARHEATPVTDVFSALLEALSAAAPQEGQAQAGLPDRATSKTEGKADLPEVQVPPDLALIAPPAAEAPAPASVVLQEAPALLAPPPVEPAPGSMLPLVATLPVPAPPMAPQQMAAPQVAMPQAATPPAASPAITDLAPAPSARTKAATPTSEPGQVEAPKAGPAKEAEPQPAPPPAIATPVARTHAEPALPALPVLPPLNDPGPAAALPATNRPAAAPSDNKPSPEAQRAAPPPPDAMPLATAPTREAPPALAALAGWTAPPKPGAGTAPVAESAPVAPPVFSFTPVAADTARPVHQVTLQALPSTPAFATELTAQVRVMLDGDMHSARLDLNPPELGPIRIELNLQGGSADISFAAAHAGTREGITQALPQLRELFAQQGLQLADAGVSAGAGQPGAQQQHAGRDEPAPRVMPWRQAEAGGGAAPAAPMPLAARIGPARGALDLYA